jgi:hypothetical protein
MHEFLGSGGEPDKAGIYVMAFNITFIVTLPRTAVKACRLRRFSGTPRRGS